MARVAFLQLNQYELLGLESIAAMLASRGHQVRLFIPGFSRDPLAELSRFQPQVVGLGLSTVERNEALAWAPVLQKRLGAKVILGGIDPTFTPELALAPGVDAVCRGEAEYTLAELVERVEAGEDFADLPGLALAREGQLQQNPVRPLISDLDTLPFPDKDLYLDRYDYFREYPTRFFMASRGCPHHCTYCANPGLRAIYPNPQDYVRFKSPSYLLAEIKTTLKKYPARNIAFHDDLFTYKTSWLKEFLGPYRREIGLPFSCAARIDAMTEEKARTLAEGGCYTCWYGLESANEKNREQTLERKISNSSIRRGAEFLHRQGILTQSYNIMNLPGESFEDGLSTLRFNLELKNDFVVASLFQPFPGTAIAKKLAAEGKLEDPAQLSGREKMSYFAFSPFRQAETDRMVNLQKFFSLVLRFPGLLPLIPRLCSLPPNPIFDILFLLSFALDYAKSHRLHWWEVAYFNLRHLRTTYFKRNRLPEDLRLTIDD